MLKSTEAAALGERHAAAVRRAREFMTRLRMTQAALAERLGVNASTLSRFLAGDPQALPEQGRPGKMEILERIEALCTSYSLIVEEAFRVSPLLDPADDTYVFAQNHTFRLRHLFKRFEGTEAAQGLAVAAELCGMALCGPVEYRAVMCARTVMYLAFLAARPDVERASPALVRSTAERLVRLEQAGIECVAAARSPESREVCGDRLIGYAGFGLVFCGMWLSDGGMIDRGVERLLQASCSNDGVRGGHWENLFQAVEELLGRKVSQGLEAARRVALELEPRREDALRQILATHDYRHLKATWESAAPDVSRWLEHPSKEA